MSPADTPLRRAAASILGRVARPSDLVLALLLAAHLLPIWTHAYFPSLDGPAHLDTANVLRGYGDPANTAFRDFYVLNSRPDPNWYGQLLLAALMRVFPPAVAEKVLLTLYVILLPLSARFALESLRPGAGALALVILPFTYNQITHLGFYNFVLSLPVFFFLLGAWTLAERKLGPARAFVLAALGLLLYFCHLFTLAMAAVAVGFLAAGTAAAEVLPFLARRPIPWSRISKSCGRPLALAALTFLPAAVLAAGFFQREGGATTFRSPPLSFLALFLARLEALVCFDERELWITTGLAVLLAGAALLALVGRTVGRNWARSDALLLLAAAYAGIHFAAPVRIAGGYFIRHRTSLFPFFALLLWLGTACHRRAGRIVLQACAAVLAVALLGVRAPAYARLDESLRSYTSASALVETNSTILPICFSPFGRAEDGTRLSSRTAVFLHAAGYVAAERNAVNLDNYQANAGYFPIVYRPEKNPFKHLEARKGGIESVPPCVNIPRYERTSGSTVDYVLAWGRKAEDAHHECVRLLDADLRAGFDRIALSPGPDVMELYRRRRE